MERILIDTDIILDFLFDRQPFSDDAAAVLSLCESGEIRGFVTPIIVSNLYYVLRRLATHEMIIERMPLLLSFLEILPIDKSVIFSAMTSGFKDFEDALQNYSAEQSNEIDVIITRNVKDYKLSSLSVMPPDDFLKMRNTH